LENSYLLQFDRAFRKQIGKVGGGVVLYDLGGKLVFLKKMDLPDAQTKKHLETKRKKAIGGNLMQELSMLNGDKVNKDMEKFG